MKESLLHHIWQHRLFNQLNLKTTEGQAITINQVGTLNNDAGPDFFNAQIQIDDIKWAGNVELHVNTSDWDKHNHSTDPAYQKLILHVVYKHDTKHLPLDTPVLELEPHISKAFLAKYERLQNSKSWIPCQDSIQHVPELTIVQSIEKMGIERLMQKSDNILALLDLNNGNWDETMYQITARYYGLKVNQQNFELLARYLPYNIVLKHKDNPTQIEALVFGVAGFLDRSIDDTYYNSLKTEYQFLKHKYQLNQLSFHNWKFMRMRPAAFPSIRLAQFAALLNNTQHLFRNHIDTVKIDEIKQFYLSEPNPYWRNKYRFEGESISRVKIAGQSFINLLLINSVAPVLFSYGVFLSNQNYKDRAIAILENCKPEKNNIISQWNDLDIKAQNAFESQALLQLKLEHCTKINCLTCSIGNQLLLSEN